MPKYEVVVGNIGTVLQNSEDEDVARGFYEAYVELSKSNIGRAGNEEVTFFIDDEIECQHDPIFAYEDKITLHNLLNAIISEPGGFAKFVKFAEDFLQYNFRWDSEHDCFRLSDFPYSEKDK